MSTQDSLSALQVAIVNKFSGNAPDNADPVSLIDDNLVAVDHVWSSNKINNIQNGIIGQISSNDNLVRAELRAELNTLNSTLTTTFNNQIANVIQGYTQRAASAATIDLDLSRSSVYEVVLEVNTLTVSFSNESQAASYFHVVFNNRLAEPATVALPANVVYSDNIAESAGTIEIGAGTTAVVNCIQFVGGTKWLATTIGTSIVEQVDNVPITPYITSPSSGSTFATVYPTFTSSSFQRPVNSAITHAATHWQISLVEDFSNSIVYDSGPLETALENLSLENVNVPLNYSTVYYVRVAHVSDTGDISTWSNGVRFLTPVQSVRPDQPVVSLTEGVVGVSQNPILNASNFTIENIESHFSTQWQIATDANFTNLALDLLTETDLQSHIVVNPLELSTTYYARVRFQDSTGDWSDWSQGITFTTLSIAPDTPVISSPTAGTTNVGTSITIYASAFTFSAETTEYQVDAQWKVTDYGSYTEVINTGVSEYATFTGLNYETRYYAQVRYLDSTGDWSQWSDEIYFTTTDAPSITTYFGVNNVDVSSTTDIDKIPVETSFITSVDSFTDSLVSSVQWQVYVTPYDSSMAQNNTFTGTVASGTLEPFYEEIKTTGRYSLDVPTLPESHLVLVRARALDIYGSYSQWPLYPDVFMTEELGPYIASSSFTNATLEPYLYGNVGTLYIPSSETYLNFTIASPTYVSINLSSDTNSEGKPLGASHVSTTWTLYITDTQMNDIQLYTTGESTVDLTSHAIPIAAYIEELPWPQLPYYRHYKLVATVTADDGRTASATQEFYTEFV